MLRYVYTWLSRTQEEDTAGDKACPRTGCMHIYSQDYKTQAVIFAPRFEPHQYLLHDPREPVTLTLKAVRHDRSTATRAMPDEPQPA
jgi:hypothetical protein